MLGDFGKPPALCWAFFAAYSLRLLPFSWTYGLAAPLIFSSSFNLLLPAFISASTGERIDMVPT